MDYETILLKQDGSVVTLTLNRPEKLNAINYKEFEEIGDALDRTMHDDSIRVLIITGSGRAFCSGADVDLMPGAGRKMTLEEMREQNRIFHRDLILRVRNYPKPIIASINGLAAGGGLEITLVTDIRIASDTARFSEIYVKRGLHPDFGGTYTLPRIIGVAKACELIFTGKWIDAKEAEKIGLVNKVVPANELEHATQEMAKEIAQAAPLVVRYVKQNIYRGLNMSFEEVLEYEAYAQTILHLTEDHKEGVRAFREKREPVFQGK